MGGVTWFWLNMTEMQHCRPDFVHSTAKLPNWWLNLEKESPAMLNSHLTMMSRWMLWTAPCFFLIFIPAYLWNISGTLSKATLGRMLMGWDYLLDDLLCTFKKIFCSLLFKNPKLVLQWDLISPVLGAKRIIFITYMRKEFIITWHSSHQTR